MVWSSEVAHSGDHSVAIHIKENYPDEKGQVSWMWVTTVRGVKVGETYRLSAWVKTQGLGLTPTILVQFKDASDRFLSRADTHSEFPITGTTDWSEVKTQFVVPPHTAHVKVRATVKAMDNKGGTVWFDDVSLIKVEQ